MHKRHKTLIFVMALVGVALSQTGYAAIIAQDNFDSYTLGSIIGQGTATDGWLNSWGGQTSTSPTPVKDIVTGQFPPDGNQSLAIGYATTSATIRNNALTRQFTAQTADTFFVGFRLKTVGMSDMGTTGPEDLCHLYFNNSNSTSSTSTHSTSLAMMIYKGNYYLREGGEDEVQVGTSVDDQIRQIVLQFTKTVSGETSNYDQIALFVDGSPAGTVTDVTGSAYQGPGAVISALHVRIDDLESTDRIHLDDLRIGTTYADVVPEPASLSLLLLGAAGYLRRKRPA